MEQKELTFGLRFDEIKLNKSFIAKKAITENIEKKNSK